MAIDPPPAAPKRPLLLDDSDSDSGHGAPPAEASITVNQEFARRFEHNKKREEKQRLEEKFSKDRPASSNDALLDSSSSSSSETEDDEGFLATEDLDAQISATLQAIRSKDPRVYDKNITFINLPEEGHDQTTADSSKGKKEKPVLLKDYHRKRFLRGDIGESDEEDGRPPPAPTYSQEQDSLKKSILSEIQAAHQAQGSDESDGDDDDNVNDFMKRKQPQQLDSNGLHPSRASSVKRSQLDVASAEKDPEGYLSNFLASRAWIPEEGGKWNAFESDEGEDDDKADQWEEAYNLRFEDPTKSNEVLRSYARDVTASRSVRRDEKTGRKRQRELQREKKEEEKSARREERARLRKLKLDEAEEKLAKIKQAAGAVGRKVHEEDWLRFLDEAWENDKWEEEMQKRFGDEYYAAEDDAPTSEHSPDAEPEAASAADESTRKRRKKKKEPRKPCWDDEIDIGDIVPDFDVAAARPSVALSDDGLDPGQDGDEDESLPPAKKRKTAEKKRDRLASQKEARRQRAKLEALVDARLELAHHPALESAAPPPGGAAPFRYRETSPQSFGLTARDILLAPSDEALNSFAGLKKLATFRDPDKKRRDRKRLGKKARLRQWRRDVFGPQYERDGPSYGFEAVAADAPPPSGSGSGFGPGHQDKDAPSSSAQKSHKKRKRSKPAPAQATEPL